MIPAPFDYHRPGTLDEAIGLLARYGTEAKVLSGGMSLLPTLKLRLGVCGHLVDIGRIPGSSTSRKSRAWCASARRPARLSSSAPKSSPRDTASSRTRYR